MKNQYIIYCCVEKHKLLTECIVLFDTDRVVCYLVEKTWLTEVSEIHHKISRKTIPIWGKYRKKVYKTLAISDDKPGCSHWEDGTLLLHYLVFVEEVGDSGCRLCSARLIMERNVPTLTLGNSLCCVRSHAPVLLEYMLTKTNAISRNASKTWGRNHQSLGHHQHQMNLKMSLDSPRVVETLVIVTDKSTLHPTIDFCYCCFKTPGAPWLGLARLDTPWTECFRIGEYHFGNISRDSSVLAETFPVLWYS